MPCGLHLGTYAGSWQAADQVQVLKCHQHLSGTYGWLPGWEGFEVLPPSPSCAFVPPSCMEVACCVFTTGEMSFGKYSASVRWCSWPAVLMGVVRTPGRLRGWSFCVVPKSPVQRSLAGWSLLQRGSALTNWSPHTPHTPPPLSALGFWAPFSLSGHRTQPRQVLERPGGGMGVVYAGGPGERWRRFEEMGIVWGRTNPSEGWPTSVWKVSVQRTSGEGGGRDHSKKHHLLN